MKLPTFATIVMVTLAVAWDEPNRRTSPLQNFPPLPPDTGSLGATFVEGAPLITVVDDSVLKDSTLIVALKARRSGSAAAVRVAKYEAIADSLFDVGQVVAVRVSPTRRLAFRGRIKNVYSSGYLSWTGDLVGGPTGIIQITRAPDGAIFGAVTLYAPIREVYGLDGMRGGIGFVTRTDYRYPMID